MATLVASCMRCFTHSCRTTAAVHCSRVVKCVSLQRLSEDQTPCSAHKPTSIRNFNRAKEVSFSPSSTTPRYLTNEVVICLKSNAARCPHLGALVITLHKTLGRINSDSSALGNDADSQPLLSVGITSIFGRSLRCP